MISIIVLSYNHDKYIAETLESVFDLNIQKEVIVIDDCSRDSSTDVIHDVVTKREASEFTRIITKDKNRGLINSLNTGLELASSEYIYFIASDDIIDPEGFSKLYNDLCNHKSAQFAMGNAWIYFSGKVPTEAVYKKQHEDFFSSDVLTLRKKIFTDFPKPLLLQGTIFKTQALKNVGGWDKSLVWDDYPMFVKLFTTYSISSDEFIFRNDIVISKYRQHDTNAYKNFLKQLNMVEEAIKKLSPPELYKTSISRQYAFYLLLTIKSGDFSTAKYILGNMIRSKVFCATIFYMSVEIIQWIHRKRK